LLGSPDDVERFARAACARLNAPLEPFRKTAFRILPQHLPQSLRERLEGEEISKPFPLDFRYPPMAGVRFIHRTHPLVSLLADTVLEDALAGKENACATRCAATVTSDVDVVTRLFVLRLRHQLTTRKRDDVRTLMAEECVTLAAAGRLDPRWLDDSEMTALLEAEPVANLDSSVAIQEIASALEFLRQQTAFLENLAEDRADSLLVDHRRVREAAKDVGSYEVTPCLPVDVLGVYVLLPADL
jgi:hypothetical protein